MCDIGCFISTVELYPHLYDKKQKLWKDNRAKENSWSEIGGLLNMTVEDCKRMWKNLRDRYTRKRKPIHHSGDEASERSTWEYLEVLRFLEPHIRTRRTFGNVSLAKPEGEYKNSEEAFDPLSLNITAPDSPASSELMSPQQTESNTEHSSQGSEYSYHDVGKQQNTSKQAAEPIKNSKRTTPSSQQTETLQRKKTRSEDNSVASLVKIAERIQASMEPPKRATPVSSAEAFGTFVSSMLMEMTPKMRIQKMNRMMGIPFE